MTRTVAITGGARGIGAAIAEALARRGDRVAIGDLDASAADEAASRLGAGVSGHALDVTSTESFTAFLDEVERRHGPLDVLINNAGIMWVGPFADEAESMAFRQFDVNLHGTLRGMKLAAPRMRARGRGHIVNIASAASRVFPPGEATYAATKHAVLGYSGVVRRELSGSGVEVSVVMPAVVDTALAAGTSAGRGRRLTPEEVAAAVVQTLDKPRFEVHVPRVNGVLGHVVMALPQRLQDRLARVFVPDQLRLTDEQARADYEAALGD